MKKESAFRFLTVLMKKENTFRFHTVPYEKESTSRFLTVLIRAAALGETYGIEIRIADQCPTAYADFTALQETDEALIDAGLDVLEEALSRYPDGFLIS